MPSVIEDERDEPVSPNRTSERRGNKTRISFRVSEKGDEEALLVPHRRPRGKGQQTQKLIKAGMKQDRICALLDDQEVDVLLESMQYFEFEQNSTIVEQGQVGAYFFVTHSGTLEVSVNRKPCNSLSRGDAFGGIALLYGCNRTASIKSLSASAVWAANGATFQKVLQQNHLRHRTEDRKLLESVRLFDGLTSKQKDSVVEAVFTEVFEAGVRVVTEGEAAPAVYFVKTGQLSVHVGGTVQPDGKFVGGKEVSSLGVGDCFGERGLILGDRRTSTVVAVARSELLCISAASLREVLGTDLAACLERNYTLMGFKASPTMSQFNSVQQLSIARAMTTHSYLPLGVINEALSFVVVLDGTMVKQQQGETIKWERGQWYEDGTVTSRGNGDARPRNLAAGPDGARLSVLTVDAFAKVLQDLGLSTKGNAEEASDRALKMALMKRVPVFRHLSQEQTLKLVQSFVPQKCKKGDSVFRQGESGSAFYVVAVGEVTVKIDGQVKRTMGKNAYFGERALLFDEPRSATIEVSSLEAEMLSVEKAMFTQVMNSNMQQELMHRIRLHDTSVTLKDVKQIKVIGTGATGVVRLVEHKTTKTRYALKRVQKVSGRVPQEVKRECDLLAENDHPFIMTLVKTFETQKSIYMLTELITGGELHGAIRMIPTVLSRAQSQFYTGSLVIVLGELADRNIVYRDLKPENVMLDHQGYLKLIDFGIAKKLDEEKSKTFTMVGTPHYMAPEVMRGQGYTTSVDLWSLGVILFEFVCGYLPFADDLDDPTEVCAAVLRAALSFPSRYRDVNGRALMQGLLCRQPKKRLGAGANGYEDVRSADYFKDQNGNAIFDKILGRELQPPLVPPGETYCDPEDAKGIVLSDAGELG